MKNKVSQQPKTWLPLYPFNIYNIQNPKIHASQKGKYKMSFPFLNSGLTSSRFWPLTRQILKFW